MIRNRLASGTHPTDSSSNFHQSSIEGGSDENEGFGRLSDANQSSSTSSFGRHQKSSLPFGTGGDRDLNDDETNDKEKHGNGNFCRLLQRKISRRNITVAAKILFILFGIRQIELLSTAQQTISPDPTTGKFVRPNQLKYTNVVNGSHVPKGGTTDRYKARKTIHSLPTNPTEYSEIETMVQNYYGRDKAWYEACALDEANSWRTNMRQNGGDIGKYFDRACPDTGLHPTVHWNPFQTKDHNCSATSRIHLEITRDHFWEKFRIQTMDARGIPKKMGGDVFYIVYSEYMYGKDGPILDESQPPLARAVAIPTDFYNGTYGLDFVSIPFADHGDTTSKHNGKRKQGRLTIHAISTCFIGELYPPLKDGWKTGGQTNVTWTIENVDRPYKIQDWYVDRYQAQQRLEFLDPNRKVLNSLLDFDRVVFAGDSMLTQMTWDVWKKDYHQIVSEKIESGKIWKGPTQDDGSPVVFHMPLSPATLQEFLDALDPFFREVGKQESIKKAFVLGSAAWDVIWPAEWQGPGFQNHLSAIEALLQRLRKDYPEVTLVWKLPYAQHMHEANHDLCFADPETAPDHGGCVQALRYATRERFENLYHRQKEFLEQKFRGDDKVRLLDLYEVSYLAGGQWMVPGDSIHYAPSFNAAVLERLLYAEQAWAT